MLRTRRFVAVVVLGTLVTLGVACGGKAAPAAAPAAPAAATPCQAVSAHLADLMAGEEDEMIGPEHHPVIARIFGERCAADAWAPATIACMRGADLAHFDGCAKQLTEVQRNAVEAQFERELKPLVEERWRRTHPDDADGKPDKLEDDRAAPATEAPAKRSAPRPDDPCGGGA